VGVTDYLTRQKLLKEKNKKRAGKGRKVIFDAKGKAKFVQ
jgi:hypothetical protein